MNRSRGTTLVIGQNTKSYHFTHYNVCLREPLLRFQNSGFKVIFIKSIVNNLSPIDYISGYIAFYYSPLPCHLLYKTFTPHFIRNLTKMSRELTKLIHSSLFNVLFIIQFLLPFSFFVYTYWLIIQYS